MYVVSKEQANSSLLFHAAEEGNLSEVQRLLELDNSEIDLNITDEDGRTPLYFAAQNGHIEVVKALLEKSANVDARRNTGSTPLFIAAQNGHIEVVKILLENKANVDASRKDSATPLCIAAHQGHTEVVKVLLQKGANVDARRNTGETPLYFAAQKGHIAVVTALLEKSANVDARRNTGETPLYVAAQNGHTEVVIALLSYNANVDASRNAGATPLYIAAQKGHIAVVTALLEKSANVDARRDNDATPLFIAAHNGHTKIVEALLNRGAKVDTLRYPRHNGGGPLYIAAHQGHTEVAITLISAGAKLTDKILSFEQDRQSLLQRVVDKLLEAQAPDTIASATAITCYAAIKKHLSQSKLRNTFNSTFAELEETLKNRLQQSLTTLNENLVTCFQADNNDGPETVMKQYSELLDTCKEHDAELFKIAIETIGNIGRETEKFSLILEKGKFSPLARSIGREATAHLVTQADESGQTPLSSILENKDAEALNILFTNGTIPCLIETDYNKVVFNGQIGSGTEIIVSLQSYPLDNEDKKDFYEQQRDVYIKETLLPRLVEATEFDETNFAWFKRHRAFLVNCLLEKYTHNKDVLAKALDPTTPLGQAINPEPSTSLFSWMQTSPETPEWVKRIKEAHYELENPSSCTSDADGKYVPTL